MESSRFRSLTPRPEKLTERTLQDPLAMMDEENDSVNKQLILIHKEYDKIKSTNRQKQTIISKLKHDVHLAKKNFNSLNEDKFALDNRVQRLENYLETVISKRKEEEQFLKSYQYLLDRIKEDKFSLDKELIRFQGDLSQKKYTLTAEQTRAKKMQEKALKNRLEITNLVTDLEKEKRIQEDTLALIEKKALERTKAVMMLEESSKKRELIADAAQGQISNLETIELRQKLLIYQLWHSVLNRKLQTELEKGGVFEEPFQKIKITTGIQTVEEILTRFLTREEAYKDLVSAVKVAENKLQDLKSKLDQSTHQLKMLKIKDGQEEEGIEEELVRTQKRSFLNYKDMTEKYQFLIQNIKEWGRKQLEEIGAEVQHDEILEMFKDIHLHGVKLMEKVKEKIQGNDLLLDDIMHTPASGLLKKGKFIKYFDENRRISPRKQSTGEEDHILLIGP